ncbi:hypothetical protein J8273_6681 [Carpediemonas membranifera]|uniref:Transmembrane protein n=1 Tax=Carpediemonas membranifera TaxID=201153 RepID=A0A8J6B173_9EUKA|nr:hypothetical protein J8273_6681 [Carpediemonas membranifera]|eukprot:KAG9392089.1 hypothetical protein J8273_6681 [Carpediemonas membranifera]
MAEPRIIVLDAFNGTFVDSSDESELSVRKDSMQHRGWNPSQSVIAETDESSSDEAIENPKYKLELLEKRHFVERHGHFIKTSVFMATVHAIATIVSILLCIISLIYYGLPVVAAYGPFLAYGATIVLVSEAVVLPSIKRFPEILVVVCICYSFIHCVLAIVVACVLSVYMTAFHVYLSLSHDPADVTLEEMMDGDADSMPWKYQPVYLIITVAFYLLAVALHILSSAPTTLLVSKYFNAFVYSRQRIRAEEIEYSSLLAEIGNYGTTSGSELEPESHGRVVSFGRQSTSEATIF